jgi:hypothetical protein
VKDPPIGRSCGNIVGHTESTGDNHAHAVDTAVAASLITHR